MQDRGQSTDAETDKGSPVAGVPQSKTKIICHGSDNICDHGDVIMPSHLTYAMDAGFAANWVSAKTGVRA